jgi:hypothetical protein
LFLPLWRNNQSLLVVGHLVAHLVTVPGNLHYTDHLLILSVFLSFLWVSSCLFIDFLEFSN